MGSQVFLQFIGSTAVFVAADAGLGGLGFAMATQYRGTGSKLAMSALAVGSAVFKKISKKKIRLGYVHCFSPFPISIDL